MLEAVDEHKNHCSVAVGDELHIYIHRRCDNIYKANANTNQTKPQHEEGK